jgi:hypothetical protein
MLYPMDSSFLNVFSPNYYADATATDQGAATVTANKTIKDLVDSIGTTKKATIVLTHNGSGNTTTYTLSTSETIPSNIMLQIENGAIISIDSSKTLTIYSPENIIAQNRQQIFSCSGDLEFTIAGKMPVVWVTDLPDGSTDNSTDIQTAIDALPAGSHLYFPATTSNYKAYNLIVKRPLTISGDGRGSVIEAKTSATGYVLKIDGTETGSVKNQELHLYGVVVRDLAFYGDCRGASIGAIYTRKLDHSTFKNLWIFEFQREAICCYSDTRECTFENIQTRWNGTLGSYPNINLYDNVITGDASNILRFDEIYSIYPLSDHIWMDTASGHGYRVRDIIFSNCKFHGLVSAKSGDGHNPGNWDFTNPDVTGFQFIKIGYATRIRITGCDFVTGGVEKAGIELNTGDGGSPEHFIFVGNNYNGHYNSANHADNICLYIADASAVVISGNIIVGLGGALTNTVKIDSGVTTVIGLNHLSGSGPTYAVNPYYQTAWDTDYSIQWGYAPFTNVGNAQLAKTPNNSYSFIKTTTSEITLSGATTTYNNALPAGTIILGVTARVTEEITGCTSFDVGINGGDADLFLDGVGVAAGTTADLANANASFTAPYINLSLATILITAVGGAASFSGGKVRLTVHYIDLVAAGS